MTNKHYLTFMLLLFGAVLSSCGSDDDGMDIVKPVTPPASGTSWTVDVVAETTRGLSVSGNVLTQSWSTTDNIFVYYKDQKVGVLHPATNVASGGVVKLLGNIDTPATPYSTNEKLYFYYGRDKGFSDYSGQDGTLDKIASDYDFATAEASITDVNTSERKLTVALASFQPQQAIVKFTFKRGDDAAATKPAINVSTFTVSAPGALANDITVTASSAASELYVALPVSSETATQYYITATATSPDFVGKLPSIALQNGKYYTSEVRLYEAVQLWANGPMWAKNNVNTKTGKYDSDGGSYFCWDGTDGRSHASYFDWAHYPDKFSSTNMSAPKKYRTNGKTLDPEDDAAYVNWGKACRIPKNDEYDALIDKTTCSWTTSGSVKGATFTGEGDYSGKSIFLPAMGYLNANYSKIQDPEICYYWSSSCIVENGDYHGGGLKVENSTTVKTAKWAARYQGMQIRPIIDWK